MELAAFQVEPEMCLLELGWLVSEGKVLVSASWFVAGVPFEVPLSTGEVPLGTRVTSEGYAGRQL